MTEDTSVSDQSDKLIMKITSRISTNFDLKDRGFGFSAFRVPMILYNSLRFWRNFCFKVTQTKI